MHIRIELDGNAVRKIIREYIRSKLGDVSLDEKRLNIQVKSTQNYKSEWETAAFRAVYEKDQED